MSEKMHFTIISNDSTDGDGGYGVGSIDLNNVTPVIIDCENEHVYIDVEALHGRSKIEKKVRFAPDLAHASDDYYRYWIVWVATQIGQNGPYYAGCTASEVRVSKEERRIKLGYKSLPEQVNYLDKALKRKFILDHIDSNSKKLLYQFLSDFNEAYWEHSPEELKQQLTITEGV
ncbi:YwhD family protein [Solibacillus sp. FSL K6-1523]|uniref:YwhD family protein n=1 Tax=Solibacillus sp. FSL K6-1523 TaxID=2921471 RepID=UPI0030F71213